MGNANPQFSIDIAGMPRGESSRPPPSPFPTRTFRQLRRQMRSPLRKHLVLSAIVLLALIFSIQSSRRYAANPSWSKTGLFSCPSNRTNFLPFPTLSKEHHNRVGDTWKSLQTLFDAHLPSPKTLPKPKHNSDLGFPTKDDLKHFLNISEHDAHRTRIEHESVLRNIPPYPEDLFSGRGVVTLAGGRYSEFAATSLGMLREVGSVLPVEVWMKDETENTKGWCEELEKEGMMCRKLDDYIDMSMLPVGYQWKIFTLLFSSFEEILFLDADSIPIQNPDFIFDSNLFKEKRAILWPDYWKHTGSPWLPYVLGISDEPSEMLQDQKSVESGQIVWDKKVHWKSLCLATYYNYLGPKYYYTLINQGWAGWGDKDTFPMALKAYRESYHQVPHDIITMFVDGSLLGIGMIQSNPVNDAAQDPLFLHSNIIKWSVRDFFCEGCEPQQKDVPYIAYTNNDKSPIHSHLNEGKRIFNTNQIKDTGLDPEPYLWKAMEHTACRTVWGTKQICQRTRRHMKKTFNAKFESSWLASFTGYGDRVCVVSPIG